MNYMHCTTCRKVVQVNATGICTGCQLGFAPPPEEECYKPTGNEEEFEPPERNDGLITVKEEMQRLREKLQEKKDAIQEPGPEEIHVCEHAGNGEEVASAHTQEQKAPKEIKRRKRKQVQ